MRDSLLWGTTRASFAVQKLAYRSENAVAAALVTDGTRANAIYYELVHNNFAVDTTILPPMNESLSNLL